MAVTVGMAATAITGIDGGHGHGHGHFGHGHHHGHRHHFVGYNSCWKWSPYGPVNVCYPRY